MKNMFRIVLLLTLTSLVLLSTSTASAENISYGGTVDPTDPTMPVVFISSPNCTGQGVAPVHYEAAKFTVATDETYIVNVSSTGGFASLYLYEGSFNPANGVANCIAADNTDPTTISAFLTAGVTYILVVFDDTFGQLGGDYAVTISGPGQICVNGSCSGSAVSAGCDAILPIPSTAVGATFLTNSEVYWMPGELSSPLVVMEAGKSVRALGLDATGQYYQVLLSCDFFWVRADTLGPNFDDVWQGAPLPTNVIE